MMVKRVLLATTCLAVFVLCDCSAETVDANSATGETWSLLRFQREFCGEDKWEPFNRSMFGVFDWGMTYVVDPFCYLYSSIIPKPLIKGIDNFSDNLEEPIRIFSNLFMGEGRAAWDATRRFAINSTLGIGGLFDPAEDTFYIVNSDASMSDTFTRWGIPAGPPLALPFMPRASVRGHVGYVVDYAFDLKTWIDFCVPSDIYVGYTWFLVPNYAPVWRGDWESMFSHASDGYALYMPLMAAVNDFNLRQFGWHYYEGQYERSHARLLAQDLPKGSKERAEAEARAEEFVNDVRPPVHASATRPEGLQGRWCEIPGFAPRSPCLDSMRALCFAPLGDDDFWWERRSLFNRDFSKKIDERKIVISDELPKAVYSFIQPPNSELETRKQKLVFVLPGISSGRTSSDAVAMAELLHAHGYGVVICDSLFHWEHMRSVNHGVLPGHLTRDIRRFADYLALILADLQENGLMDEPEVSVLGWSMGGLSVAHFAALDDRDELPVKVKRFVAINPPASMSHALAPFKPVYESSRNWTKDHARKMFAEAAPSLYGWAAQDHPRYDPDDRPLDTIGDPWDYAPNLTEEQSNYLLGQTMRVIFPALIAERHRLVPFPWIKSELTWFHRNDFYAEVGDVSMEEYIHKYVPTCYDGTTADEMIASADIRNLESALVRNRKLSVIHTWNDPLEDDVDRRWFDTTLKDRISWFADGGHCGYFYAKPFETELFRRLSE